MRDGVPPGYADLTQKDHVFSNLERSFKERNLDEFARLLDDGFEWVFSVDQLPRPSTPDALVWRRNMEIETATNMFDPEYQGDADAITSISLSLTHINTWNDIPAPDQAQYPNETWSVTHVTYRLLAETEGDVTYFADNAYAAITIRPVAAEGGVVWRIVRFDDDVTLPQPETSSASTEETTLGKIMLLYAPDVVPYENLSRKQDLVTNLWLSYNQRNLDECTDLFDPNFVFFFAGDDVVADDRFFAAVLLVALGAKNFDRFSEELGEEQ